MRCFITPWHSQCWAGSLQQSSVSACLQAAGAITLKNRLGRRWRAPRAAARVSNLNSGTDVGEGDRHERFMLMFTASSGLAGEPCGRRCAQLISSARRADHTSPGRNRCCHRSSAMVHVVKSGFRVLNPKP